MAHKFWARKPLNVIRAYIEHFTDKGDLICDPFTGSGITNIASLQLERKTIGVDLDPIGIFVTKMSACHADITKFEQEFKRLEEIISPKIYQLYTIKCPKCKTSAIITHIITEREYQITNQGKQQIIEFLKEKETHQILKFLKENGSCRYTVIRNFINLKSNALTKLLNDLVDSRFVTVKDKQIEYKYDCPKCKNNKFHQFDNEIESQLNSNFNKLEFKWYPKNRLYHNSRICAYKDMKISDLFSPRNLKALSILLDEIEKIKNKELKDLFRFTFSSSLPQASKLVFVIEQRGRTTGHITKTKEVGSWTLPSFTVMPKHFEINVLNCFKERFEKVKRAKEEANYKIPIFEELPKKELEKYQKLTKNLPSNNPHKKSYFDRLFKHYNLAIIWSTLNLNLIPNNSIDYIFTDPPYGDSIPYLELSIFFNSWLYYKGEYPEFEPDWEEEIVISDSKERNKIPEEYKKLLSTAFKEIYRILKPDGWMSLTFHNRDLETWNALITSAQESGFEYINDAYQVPPRASAKSGLASSGSMIGDIIVNFKKVQKIGIIRTVKEEDVEKLVYKEAKSLLEERYGKATENQLMRGVIHILLKKNLTRQIINPKSYITRVLGKYFDKKADYWYLRKEEKKENIIPLEEKIEEFIISLISKRGGATFDEILSILFTNLKNGHTPESTEIWKVLKRIGEFKKDRWILKGQKQLLTEKIISPQELKKEETKQKELTQHNKCIEILAKLAEKINLKKSIGHTELIQNEQLRIYHEPLNKTGIPLDALDQIAEIDMVFSKNNVIQSCFEIEFSTLKTEKFLSRYRTLRVVTPNMNIPLFVIISPKDERSINKILLHRGNLNIDVDYILDSDLFTLYNDVINNKITLTLDHFKKISKKVQKQKILKEF
jgi:DNA modification methylase/predicted nucleic-acid-binding Zn-ribbon protein